MAKKLTLKEFISRAINIHGDKYDYSLVNYVNSNTKVTIICKEHGIFEQSPYKHLKGQGCKKCNYKNNNKTRRLTTESFIEKANKVHNNFYNYDFTIFEKSNKKVSIVCPIHGMFLQEANGHLQGKGCRSCGYMNFESKDKDLKKLIEYIRALIGVSYRNKSFGPKVEHIIGCNYNDFKKYLEDNPYGFKVGEDNLDLDHIVPISKADNEEEVVVLNRFTNFQLLPKEYNRWVKKNKVFNKNHFEKWFKNVKQ